jgi:hypothetical protein
MPECSRCNTNNAAGMMQCTTCGSDLPFTNPTVAMAKPKAVVLITEQAVLDESAAIRVAKRKGLSGKRFDREVSLNIEKSPAVRGVRDFLNGLVKDNYIVAYLTDKDDEFRYRVQAHLREQGLPVMADEQGVLVLPGPVQDNIRSLSKRYDITYFFGTTGAGTVKRMNVPGVYATVGDYIGQPENPYIAPEATPGAYTLSGLRPEPTPGAYTLTNPSDMGFRFVCRVCGKNPPMEECAQDARGVLVHMVDGGELRLVNEGMAQKIQQGIPQGPLRNPVPKPRRQTSKKTGKKRRESAKSYFQRLHSALHEEFPGNRQRNAVALSYVEKEYGKRGVASVTKSWSPMTNPASPKKVKKAEAAYKKFHGGKTPDEITTAQIDVGDVWYSLGECWTIGYMSPKENGDETQKFIHEMNEESKDGNYPVLYATMPENGEPMLIIKGGSMKIGMRDGKAWLID